MKIIYDRERVRKQKLVFFLILILFVAPILGLIISVANYVVFDVKQEITYFKCCFAGCIFLTLHYWSQVINAWIGQVTDY